jgi:hypothetical protein
MLEFETLSSTVAFTAIFQGLCAGTSRKSWNQNGHYHISESAALRGFGQVATASVNWGYNPLKPETLYAVIKSWTGAITQRF